MNNFFKKLLIALAASIGAVAILLSILYLLGYDVPVIDECLSKCPCRCISKKKSTAKASGGSSTKVKRHYTRLVLPQD